MEFEERATTAIHIRVKRFQETYFLLCDEYETVESLKGRLLGVLQKIKFELPKQEEPLTTDDIRLCIKNRVSYAKANPFRFWMQAQLVTTNKFLTIQSFMFCLKNQGLRTNSMSWKKQPGRSLHISIRRKKTNLIPAKQIDFLI